MKNQPLSTARADAYRQALQHEERGPLAFVAIVPEPSVALLGIHGALGIAVANERGYHPVPLGWARFDSMDAAQSCADELNRFLGLSDEEEAHVIASTMGGRRYHRQSAA